MLFRSELQLLGKLIQNLPGSKIRLVLLLAGATSHSFVMASLKRRMLRWDIELPSVEQALSALQFSEQSGQLIHLRRLLAKICAQDPQAAAVADTLTLDPNKQFKPMRIPRLPAGQAPSPNETAPDKARKAWKTLPWKNLSWKNFLPVGHQGLKIAAVVIIALVISTAMMMWTQPGAFGLPTGKPVAAKPALSNPPIEITEWKNDPGPSAQGASTSSQAPVSPTARPSSDAPKPNLKPEAKPATLGAGATRAQLLATIKPEVPAKTRFNDLKVAGQWMQELPPQGYVIVYGTSPTLAEAQALQKKYTSLAGSIIVQTFKDTPANIRYTVSSEGYDSAALAYRDLKSDTFPAGIWVRPTKDLQKELVQASPTDRRM